MRHEYSAMDLAPISDTIASPLQGDTKDVAASAVLAAQHDLLCVTKAGAAYAQKETEHAHSDVDWRVGCPQARRFSPTTKWWLHCGSTRASLTVIMCKQIPEGFRTPELYDGCSHFDCRSVAFVRACGPRSAA